MGWTIQAVLEDPNIRDARQISATDFTFRLGTLATLLTMRLTKRPGDHGVCFTQSHFIKTPVQGDPYQTSRPWGDDTAYALHMAISSITQFYVSAIRAGHEPNEDWLVPNAAFP